MGPSIFISAGEVSGDLHAAHLIRALKRKGITQFAGMGGAEMAAEGVSIVTSVINRSTIGFFEPIRHLFAFYFTFRKLKNWLKTNRPTVMIAVDFQGFNVPLCRVAKALGIPVVYYIAPQEWQWGSEAGGRRVVAATDLILSIFEQEHAFYARLGAKSVFVGHPLLDIVPAVAALPADAPLIISVFPGSRSQEIQQVLPIFVQALTRIQIQFPDIQIVVSVATSYLRPKIESEFNKSGLRNVMLKEAAAYDVMAAGTISLVTSGTVTLEHAIMKKPAVAGYRFHPISYRIGRILIGKKFDRQVGYIALPNIYLKRMAMPEFLQSACTPQALAHACITLLSSTERREALIRDFEQVKTLLGTPGAVDRAAEIVSSTWFSGIMTPEVNT